MSKAHLDPLFGGPDQSIWAAYKPDQSEVVAMTVCGIHAFD
ncbi:hypothetical protein BOO71_0000586 [Deinococcus marmoris]|uniref:Uncharacterized protein n=1 Tax=Deinococcus marmoris TaxID=249408 RepID=A0A1U7P4V2_9DEIO|nr:hypothetical protein BOO71_0000586 [Deinococcus marmoris]